MEADWSVEIGPAQPRIDAAWDGFIDLRKFPQSIDRLSEASQHPALRAALSALNAENSGVFTTKCDTWPLNSPEMDPDEFGATREHTAAGFACYIDVLQRTAANFVSFAFHERRAKELTIRLRSLDLRQARLDIVVREAVSARACGFGLTLYVAACGASEAAAYQAWEAALLAVVAATIASVPGE